MRTVLLERFGEPPDVLQVGQHDLRPPGRGEVRLRMLAAPVNPSDLMMIRGRYGTLPELPAVPGFEGSGRVEETGGGLLGRWLLGKRVAVLNAGGGCWAEEAIVPAAQCVPLPSQLPVAQGAMFFVNPTTAWAMTRQVLAIRRGQWLIQSAAAGSLGQMVIRLGRHFGFHTINVVRRAEQAARIASLGGDVTVVFDPERDAPETLFEATHQATGGNGPEFAIDPVGGLIGTALAGTLAHRGRMLLFGSLSGEAIPLDSRMMLQRGLSVEGFWLSRWLRHQSLMNKFATVRAVSRLMKAGVLVNDVGPSFALEEIGQAVKAAETSGRAGKVWLDLT